MKNDITSRYQALPSRVVSLIKPVLPEQTVNAYFWSHAASQVDLYYNLAITSNFCDGLLIRLPSSVTARPPKLYWFIRNGHNSLTTSSLDCRKLLPHFLHHDPFFSVLIFLFSSNFCLLNFGASCQQCLRLEAEERPSCSALLRHDYFTMENFSRIFLEELRTKINREVERNPLLKAPATSAVVTASTSTSITDPISRLTKSPLNPTGAKIAAIGTTDSPAGTRLMQAVSRLEPTSLGHGTTANADDTGLLDFFYNSTSSRLHLLWLHLGLKGLWASRHRRMDNSICPTLCTRLKGNQ
ncbi:unnamed protein product [Protopolystoma xenopodis]|uniref:Uncharacterized protein n=1 Tax=Protopolystoma xenopodis TaxID=117903 RepID=A0A448WAK5_9PLAT|nr:unnamed protein product [Protopolystoma xenopodis]